MKYPYYLVTCVAAAALVYASPALAESYSSTGRNIGAKRANTRNQRDRTSLHRTADRDTGTDNGGSYSQGTYTGGSYSSTDRNARADRTGDYRYTRDYSADRYDDRARTSPNNDYTAGRSGRNDMDRGDINYYN